MPRCDAFAVSFPVFLTSLLPYKVEDLYFRLIGRKQILTAGRVGTHPSTSKAVQCTGIGQKKKEDSILIQKDKDN